MSILSISNLSKAYKASPLFKNINLQVQSGEKIALVGDNGSGKSTLLKIIAGLEEPDSGTVKFANSILIDYLSQHMQELTDLDRPVLVDRLQEEYENKLKEISTDIAYLSSSEQEKLLSEYQHISDKFERRGGYSYLPKLTQALNALGIKGEILNRPIRTLSGGERMRILLAEKLLDNADLLLLDEPTNHLDIEGLEWLENFIKNYNGTIIVVSHDRYFLDQFADRTCELFNNTLTSYQGNYTSFIRQKQERLDIKKKTLENLEKEQERQEDITSTLLSHRKMGSYHSREKIVKKLGETIEELRAQLPRKSKNMHFNFLPVDDNRDENRLIIQAENLSFAWDASNVLFKNFNLKLKAKDKKVLLGANGAGKSTLLDILMGLNTNYEGKITIAPDVKFAHLGQFVEFPNEELTILEEIQERTLMLEAEARNLLAKYGFFRDEVFKQIKVLSGGEKSRLYLACIILENPDLLYLDEPTNHLDIHSREILESAINEFNGAVLAVSHDRYFIKKCGLDILGFTGTEIKEYSNYESYSHFANIFRNNLKFENKTNIAGKYNLSRFNTNDKASKKQLQILKRNKNELEKELNELVEEISTIESQLETLINQMEGDSMDQYLEYAKLNDDLDSKSENYFQLGEELEQIIKKIAEFE